MLVLKWDSRIGDISSACSDLVDKLISKMKNNTSCKEFLPSREERPHCHRSHEAREYAYALVTAILYRIMKSDEIVEVLQKQGFNISY
jgi:hypothetical protein